MDWPKNCWKTIPGWILPVEGPSSFEIFLPPAAPFCLISPEVFLALSILHGKRILYLKKRTGQHFTDPAELLPRTKHRRISFRWLFVRNSSSPRAAACQSIQFFLTVCWWRLRAIWISFLLDNVIRLVQTKAGGISEGSAISQDWKALHTVGGSPPRQITTLNSKPKSNKC